MLNNGLIIMDKFSIIPHSRPWITKLDISEVHKILESKVISNQKISKKLEEKILQKLKTKYGLLQSSGTAAIICALKALNICPGDNVVIPTYVCRSVMDSINYIGAEANICDVNDKGVLTNKTVSSVINENTRAIIAVHTFGHLCDIKSLRKFNIPIIEDACQAFGLKKENNFAGSMGDIGILSFHATKCLTTGEGGMLLINNEEIISVGEKNKNLNLFSFSRKISPLSDLQAALGLSQLRRFSEFSNRRKELLRLYIRTSNKLGLDIQTDMNSNLPFRFTLKTKLQFIDVKEKFEKIGIHVRKGVDELLHRIVGLDDKEYPNAVGLYNETISIPYYPSLTKDEVQRIIKSLEIIS